MSLEVIETYYKDKIKAENPDYRIHGWESKEAHLSRLSVLYNEVKLKGKSLLDVGCGVGSLYRFLKERKTKISYVGVDILEEMVQLARFRYPEALFMQQNLFEDNPFPDSSFDIVYASGIFNLDLGNNESFIQDAIALFARLATHQVVFNLLSIESENKEAGYFYADPQSIPHLLRKSGIRYKNYKLVQNYLKNDFTVIIQLEPKEEKYLKYESSESNRKKEFDKHQKRKKR